MQCATLNHPMLQTRRLRNRLAIFRLCRMELCVISATKSGIFAYTVIGIRLNKCENYDHQDLEYAATVLSGSDMRYQILKM